MYQRVKAYVEEQHMLEKKDRVIVGVSGGENAQLSGTSTAQLPAWKEQDFTRSRVWPK